MVDACYALVLAVLPALSGCGGGGTHATCGSPAADGGLVAVAMGMQEALAIAVDSTNVYWIGESNNVSPGLSAMPDGQVLQCAKCACDHPTILATNEPFGASGIAVDATSVYWTNGDVMRVPIGGGEATALAVGQTLGAIAVDTTSVYWADMGGLMKVSIHGGRAGVLVPRNDVSAIVVDSSNVYYAAGNGIFKVPLGGGAPTLLAMLVGPANTLAVDSANVYWTLSPSVPVAAALEKVPIAGGDPTMVATGFQNPAGLAVDATSAYWTSDLGLMKVSTSGGKPTTLASGASVNDSPAIALDATSVYWTDGIEGAVVTKLPK